MALCIMGFLCASCNQRFLFRKKVKIDNDSTEVEKDFKIVW